MGGALKPGRAVEGPSTVSNFKKLCVEHALYYVFSHLVVEGDELTGCGCVFDLHRC